jgi:hypothetical protein
MLGGNIEPFFLNGILSTHSMQRYSVRILKRPPSKGPAAVPSVGSWQRWTAADPALASQAPPSVARALNQHVT